MSAVWKQSLIFIVVMRKDGEVGMKKEYIVELREEEADELMDEHWVSELVRCKDCKNAVVYDGNEVICTHIDSNGNDKHSNDWFCADGERREENENGV